MNTKAIADRRHVPETSFPEGGDVETQATYLLNYAALAPSSHNSQPWAFAIDGPSIEVFADHSRSFPVADPDERELYVSVGCALETLEIAATYFGLDPSIEFADPADDPLVTSVHLHPGGDQGTNRDLFEAIPDRQTNHTEFDGGSLDPSVRKTLRQAAEASDVTVMFLDESETEALTALQQRADERLFDDPAYRQELGESIGRGTLGDTGLSKRIAGLAVRYLDLGASEGRKNVARIESASSVGIVTTDGSDSIAQVQAGQAFQRLALQATVEGLAIQPMNQVLEVPDLKSELGATLDLQPDRLQMLFRLGYADPDPTVTPRRPVSELLR